MKEFGFLITVSNIGKPAVNVPNINDYNRLMIVKLFVGTNEIVNP